MRQVNAPSRELNICTRDAILPGKNHVDICDNSVYSGYPGGCATPLFQAARRNSPSSSSTTVAGKVKT